LACLGCPWPNTVRNSPIMNLSSLVATPMSQMGQTETNWHVRVMSGLTPITDINLGQIARQAARRLDLTGRISRL
jgi:hypothetical protein